MRAASFNLSLSMGRLVMAGFLSTVALSIEASASESLLAPQKALSAWRCSVLAATANKPQAEIDRLFSLGYSYGKAALAARSRGEFDNLSSEDWQKYFPGEWTSNLFGSRDDFKLGGIYSAVFNKTLDEMIHVMRYGIFRDALKQDAVREKFEKEYADDNCSSLTWYTTSARVMPWWIPAKFSKDPFVKVSFRLRTGSSVNGCRAVDAHLV